MRKVVLRLTAQLDAAALSDYIIRALLARQSGAVLEAIDLSKLSAEHLQVYCTIRLPQEVLADDIQEWLTSSGELTPFSVPFVLTHLMDESRRLDAEARIDRSLITVLATPPLGGGDIEYQRTAEGANVTCPRCGNPIPVVEREIDKDGIKAGRLECPWGCGYKAPAVRFQDWGGSLS